MPFYADLKARCAEANRRLPELGLVDLTFGNASVADRARRVFAIKPSGVDYAALRDDDIVVMDFEGRIVEGSLRPSSDAPTHRYLLREFEAVESVVHTHSRKAVAFAQAGREIPCLGTTHADYWRGAVPVTRGMTPEEIAGEYEWNTGAVIAEALAGTDPLALPGALVRYHGPFAWGDSWQKAVENALALEIVAEMALDTLALASGVLPIPAALHGKHFLRKHGPLAYYGQR